MPQEPDGSPSPQESEDFERILIQLTDRIWEDLDGQVGKDIVHQTLLEQAARYQDAPVRTFIPIFLYRSAIAQLKSETQSLKKPALAGEEIPADLKWEDLLLTEQTESA